ncbi:CPBP family intramembrane glutamic endopeptidase [Aeromicrobium sp. Leaf350]|uniref:CPBP family intramembrane glutamic endopeptidase n=1 Tax=Aeromicrobium sp. Leaf350 TaxID=2876565 RepID=UPI001E4ECB79|nr:CPBP family intramembrane glutamic endopeptidase [Aeromicrobium sp. Leaf350]
MATPYHRLAREHPDHEWWKLPVAGLIGAFGYVLAAAALTVGALLVLVIASGGDGDEIERWIDDLGAGLMSSPWELGFSLLLIALMLPAVLLSVLATGPRPVGYLSSVEGRLRWGWLAQVGAVALVLYAAAILGGLALGLGGELDAPSLADDAWIYFAVALLVTPLQATAEEYVFRGYLFQLVGSWTRWAVVPVLVSTPLFVAGHLYEFWGLVDVTIFALTASWLVIRTGGLEAAIAAHVANNLVLFTLESFNTVGVTSEEYGVLDVLPTLVTSIVFVLLVEVMARARGLQRTRPPMPPKPPPPPPPTWAPGYVYPYPYPYPPAYHPYPQQPGHAYPVASPQPYPLPPPPPQEASHD